MLSAGTIDCVRKLKQRQGNFVLAYAATTSKTRGNGAASAVAAGYRPERARVTASELLARRDIREAVIRVERDYQDKTEAIKLVDNAWMHRKLSAMADTSILDFIRIDEGSPLLELGAGMALDLKALSEHPEASRRVDSIKVKIPESKDWRAEVEIKMMPMERILRLLGEHVDVGSWREPEQAEDRSGLAEDLIAARKRVAQRARAGGGRLRVVDSTGSDEADE